jgi:hypothetical protein
MPGGNEPLAESVGMEERSAVLGGDAAADAVANDPDANPT